MIDKNNEVINFINGFIEKAEQLGINCDKFCQVFSSGYCLYFANMLKFAFDRGDVYILAPIGHVVWMDDDGKMYDIWGERDHGDEEALVPISDSDSHVQDFKHINNVGPGITKEELQKLIKKYGDEI